MATDAPRRSAPWIAGTIALVLVAFIGMLATRKQGDASDNFALAGKAAPLIRGTSLAGTDFDLNDHKGQWVLVNFFATTCAPCRHEHPDLVRWYNDHTVKGDATLVSVVFNEGREDVEKYFAKEGGDWPVLPNEDGAISAAFGVVKLPESYLVDPNGRVQVKFRGAVSQEQLDDRIARLTGAS